MQYERLARIVEAVLKNKGDYCVYMLLNDTKEEIYFGVSNDLQNRYQEHSKGYVDATKHWGFSTDRIRYNVITCGHTQEVASRKSHALEKTLVNINGYEVIQTAGI